MRHVQTRDGQSQALHGALKDAQTGFQALAAITAVFLLLCHLEASESIHTCTGECCVHRDTLL